MNKLNQCQTSPDCKALQCPSQSHVYFPSCLILFLTELHLSALPSTNYSLSFLVLCFTLDILCSVTLLREQFRASIAKQLHYFRLLIQTHPFNCRSFENYFKKNHYLVLGSPMTAEPPLQGGKDLVNSYGLSDSPCYVCFLSFSFLLRESLLSHRNII